MIGKIDTIITKLSLLLGAVIFVNMPAFAAGPSAVSATDNAHPIMDEHIMAGDEHLAAAHKELEGLPQLDFTAYTPQLFWMVMFFALLYIIFAKKTLPDISNTIENRKNHVQSDLEAAEKLTAEADQVHDAYNEGLVGAQNAANETIQKMEGKMKTKAEKAMNDFRVRSEDEIKNAEDRIIAAKQAAMGEMNQIVTDVTTQAVEKILGQTADKAAVQSTVETLNSTPKAKAA